MGPRGVHCHSATAPRGRLTPPQLQTLPQEFADGLVLPRNLVWKGLEKPEPGCSPEQVWPGTQEGGTCLLSVPCPHSGTLQWGWDPSRTTQPWSEWPEPGCFRLSDSRKQRQYLTEMREIWFIIRRRPPRPQEVCWQHSVPGSLVTFASVVTQATFSTPPAQPQCCSPALPDMTYIESFGLGLFFQSGFFPWPRLP